jgi:uncharacterized protein YndB with AHSA1/START domain
MAARKSSSTTRAKSAKAKERELVMTHLFDAPRALVWAAWTERQHLERWQGAPKGFTVTTAQADIRPGGAFRICMRSPEGVDHWLQGIYREVVAPERLVFTHTWLDAQMKPTTETLVTITFSERGPKTELTLRQTGFKSDDSRAGHEDGWASTLDRLAEYLAGEHSNPSSVARKS